MSAPRRRARAPMPLRAVVLSAALAAVSAHAVLGEDASTIRDDQVRIKGARREATPLNVQVQTHELTMADGSSIREFVSPGGIVFAVAWSTRLKPNLEALLGQHASSYAAAASEAMKTPGIKRNVVLRRDDLVVHSVAHLNSFVGKAYLRSLVPAGVNVDELH